MGMDTLNPSRQAQHFNSRYQIQPEQYYALLEMQGGVCAGCASPPREGRMLSVDHCHNTEGIRGLLCQNCNAALGMVKDTPEVLRRLANYLEQAPAIPPEDRIYRNGNTGKCQREKTHCAKGHPFSPENTWVSPSTGWRDCKTCRREIGRRRYANKPGVAERQRERNREYRERTREMKAPKMPPSFCAQGHEYNTDNTYTYQKTGKRYCRACRRLLTAKWKAAKKSSSEF